MSRKDLAKQIFGRLTVLRKSDTVKSHRYWKCHCECGKVCRIREDGLLTNHTRSCGCLHRPHGQRLVNGKMSPEYLAWSGMRKRCLWKTGPTYHRYGGRGITICKRWKNFVNFFADMGKKPSLGHSLDRIDNSKGYYKENCRWATVKEQANNRRNNRIILFRGMKKNLIQWAEFAKIKEATLRRRFDHYGWSFEESLNTPVRVRVS